MILPLELLCQLTLVYESFKALKAAPPARKRRRANEQQQNGSTSDASTRTASSHAETLRKRKIKAILKCWIVYILANRVERVSDVFLWWIPLYGSLKSVGVVAFLFYTSPISDIAFSSILTPALKPYEKTLNWLHGHLCDVLDVLAYVLSSLLAIIFSPFLALTGRMRDLIAQLLPSSESQRGDSRFDAAGSEGDEVGTPRKGKNTRKPRYSQVATPYAPGHLLDRQTSPLEEGTAQEQRKRLPLYSHLATPAPPGHLAYYSNISVEIPSPEVRTAYPPIQQRRKGPIPAEKSLNDSLPAFMDAMDRAQMAFYEPEEQQIREEETEGGAVVPPSGKVNGKRRLAHDVLEENGLQATIQATSKESVKKRKVAASTRVDEAIHASAKKATSGESHQDTSVGQQQQPSTRTSKRILEREDAADPFLMPKNAGSRPHGTKRTASTASLSALAASAPVSKLPKRSGATSAGAAEPAGRSGNGNKTLERQTSVGTAAQKAREAALLKRRAAQKEEASQNGKNRKKHG